jgi:hypothetical protein
MTEKQEGHLEKDHQAAGTSGKTGPEIAALAKAELGLNEKDVGDFSQGRNESSDKLGALPIPDVDPSRKVERTASGTHITGHARDASGQETVRGFGMVPVTRQQSLPPAVSPFGGVAPTGPDAEMGLRAVRSHEEEEEREAEMQKTGPDPWSVRFEPGEKINPKVSGASGLFKTVQLFPGSAPVPPAGVRRARADAIRTGASPTDGTSPVLPVCSCSTRRSHRPRLAVSFPTWKRSLVSRKKSLS